MSGLKRKPYWLEQGEVTCEICEHTVIVQAVLRCTGCDAGICEHCALTIHETHEIVCAPCRELEERG
ncbi:MAG TPA: hypothetical protein VK922_00675 [Gemmatimonadaceae bacterium]|nr:hypothetical protein [Gemmatimonadaceae bacterium]